MTTTLDLQIACNNEQIPTQAQFCQWCDIVLEPLKRNFELTIRVVDPQESQQLNHQYRGKDKPTNVLSFEFDAPKDIDINLLGDLIICADVVEQEAQQQQKPLIAHWAHMTIHGCLHLLGYDHINDADAAKMEALEIKLLAQLGYDNPYEPN